MAFNKLAQVFQKPKYLVIGLLTAIFVAWLYIGPLTDQAHYHNLGWIFAITFPLLVGAIIATQIYNRIEVKTCPAKASAGGLAGSIIGLITVSCASCPLILLGWIGLGAALPGSLVGGIWLKVVSLGLLVLSLHWTSKR